MFAVPVQPGDTMSGIAAEHGVSLSALEAANPQVSNPDLIYVGENLNLPGGGTGTVTATPPTTTKSAPSYSSASGPSDLPARPVASAPVSSSPSAGDSSGFDVPGVPHSFTQCVAFRESTSGTNPAAHGNVYGIIPASGHNVEGASLSTQKAAFKSIYDTTGPSAWSADGCPGT